MRLIDADVLIEEFEPLHRHDWYTPWIIGKIEEAPTIEAVPVKHGKWTSQNEGRTLFMCSQCGTKNHGGHERFCPNCGARMDGEE